MIQHMGHAAFRVRDVEKSVDHYTRICGLQVTEVDGDTTYLSSTANHHEVQLIASDHDGLDHLGLLAADDDAVAEIARRAREAGSLIDEAADTHAISGGIRVQGPFGHVFEVYSAMDQVDSRYDTFGVRPVKYEHANCTVPDVEKQCRWMVDVLGFKLSDWLSGWAACWMRCNPEHHGIAFLGNPQAGINHIAFQIQDWSVINRLGDHLLAHDQRFVYGPGRHGPGLNLFCYHMEPSGVIIEYCADMQRIYHDSDYPAREWPATPESINQWGAPPPDVFMTHSMPLARR